MAGNKASGASAIPVDDNIDALPNHKEALQQQPERHGRLTSQSQSSELVLYCKASGKARVLFVVVALVASV